MSKMELEVGLFFIFSAVLKGRFQQNYYTNISLHTYSLSLFHSTKVYQTVMSNRNTFFFTGLVNLMIFDFIQSLRIDLIIMDWVQRRFRLIVKLPILLNQSHNSLSICHPCLNLHHFFATSSQIIFQSLLNRE